MSDTEKIKKILEAVGVTVLKGDPGFSLQIPYVILGECEHYLCNISNDLNAIRELELLVIEKVGAEAYGMALVMALSIEDEIDVLEVSVIATADAPTRIAAMLAALEGLE